MNDTAFHEHPFSRPLFVLLSITLPQTLLLGLTLQSYNVIHSLLDEAQRHLWWTFGASLSAMLLGISAYALWRWFEKKAVSIWLAPIVVGLYGTYLTLYFTHLNTLFPNNIPSWMINGDNLFRYPGAFIIPALAYATFLGVLWLTPSQPKKWLALKSFTASALIPACWYVFFNLFAPLFRYVDNRFITHIMIILGLISTLVFLLFLLRGVYLLMRHRHPSNRWHRLWLLLFTLVLPVAGLVLNAGSFGMFFGTHLFGDFSHPAFMILCVLNGMLLVLPERPNAKHNLALYGARSVTFAFTVYFFLVFMPYLPLSVFAILIFGLGALMLSPMVLMLIHTRLLHQQFQRLTQDYPRPVLLLVSVCAFMLLPGMLTGYQWHDRSTLHNALQQVYEPDYFAPATARIDLKALHTVLGKIKGDKQDRRWDDGVFSSDTPFISGYYQWLVLDNLTLSNQKIERLEKIFLHRNERNERRPVQAFPNAQLDQFSSNSEYHSSGHYWQSTLNLAIHNPHERMAEYRSHFALPPGTWVTGYHLEINGNMVPGVLVEKKSAQWVYNNVRRQRRDPGLVYYDNADTIGLRIFPFNANQTRRIRLTLTHQLPISVTLDAQTVVLGQTTPMPNHITQTKHSVFIPGTVAATLPTMQRTPYFHFIVDTSQANAAPKQDYVAQIEALIAQYPATATASKITLANFARRTYAYSDDWRAALTNSTAQGGFFLDAAMRSALLTSYHTQQPIYPVIVVLTPALEQAILPTHLNAFAFTFLEQDRYFVVDQHNTRSAHRLSDNQALAATPIIVDAQPISVWQQGPYRAHLLARGENSVTPLIHASLAPWVVGAAATDNPWLAGLTMQSLYLRHLQQPQEGATDWLTLVRFSFAQQVLTPVTSYIVTENAAQMAALKQKQAQVLNAAKYLDIDESAEHMSEPALWLLVLLLGVFRLRQLKQA